jgi:TonB family protein
MIGKLGIATAAAGLAVLLCAAPVAAPASTPTAGIPTILQQVRIGDAPLIQDTGMTPPIALFHPAPRYTIEALNWGIEGVVTVEAEFTIDGSFEIRRVVKGLPFGLDAMALEALGSWRFRPAYRNGRRVPVVANIDVEFRSPRSMEVHRMMHEIVGRLDAIAGELDRAHRP